MAVWAIGQRPKTNTTIWWPAGFSRTRRPADIPKLARKIPPRKKNSLDWQRRQAVEPLEKHEPSTSTKQKKKSLFFPWKKIYNNVFRIEKSICINFLSPERAAYCSLTGGTAETRATSQETGRCGYRSKLVHSPRSFRKSRTGRHSAVSGLVLFTKLKVKSV